MTEKFSKHPYLSLAIIPLCQAIWANMHGLYVLGIGFLLFYLLVDLLQVVISQYLSIIPKLSISSKEWKQKGILFFLTCIAIFANANGKDGILYPHKIFHELRTKTLVFSRVTELISPFSIKHASFPDPSIIYKIFLILSILAIICQLKHLRLAHILTFSSFLYLSVLAIRNMPLFAIIATPITIRNIYGILDFFNKRRLKGFLKHLPVSSPINICLIVFAIIICFFIANNRLYQRLHYLRTFGIGESDYYPADAVNYLKTKNISGNIFNSSDIGGYLIWKIYPQHQVSLDGRWEVYGDFLENIQKLSDPFYFAQLVSRYNIEAIILHKRSWEIQLMGPWLQINKFWQLTVNTNNAVVFEKIKGFE